MRVRVLVVGSAAVLTLLLAGCTLLPLNDSFDFEANAYDYTIEDLALGIAFPPNGNVEQRDFTVEQLTALSIDRILIGQAWELREPERDQFNWAPLDARMDRFREYVAAFLRRYGTDVEFIQFGNEWNWEIDEFLNGDDAAFTRFANILYTEVMKLPPDARPTVVFASVAIGGLRGVAFALTELDNVYFDGVPLYGEEELAAADRATPEAIERYRTIVENVNFEAVDLHRLMRIASGHVVMLEQTIGEHVPARGSERLVLRALFYRDELPEL
jgi:hypothetical protein